ncbi:MAG: hypothetical protein U0T83_05765 [Bacteriovoracaceae bacterium]
MNRLIYLIIFLIFSQVLMAEVSKKIFVADVTSKNITSSVRIELKKFIQKEMAKNKHVSFSISNLKDINHHLKVEKEKQLKGICDDACEARIVAAVSANSNADELILLKMRKVGSDFEVDAKRVDLNMKIKSKVNLIFPQKELKYFSEEIAKKLMNSKYKILNLKSVEFDEDEESPFINDSKRSNHKQKSLEGYKSLEQKSKNQ